MLRLFVCLGVAGLLVASGGAVPGQDRGGGGPSDLQKENALLKRELDLLKREIELLKKEYAELKKAATGKKEDAEADAVTRVTVGNVEYVWQGTVRNGSSMIATVLATSKDGNQPANHGHMTIIDSDGEKYMGHAMGAKVTLREGVPVKLSWQFGKDGFTGGAKPLPSTKVERFGAVIISRAVVSDKNAIEFRNVPATVMKAKGK